LQADPKNRFSKRAQYYTAYRPRYPDVLLRYLESKLAFSRQSVIADIGSGTGILTELLLSNGNTVYGIEPNADMRRIAEANLLRYPNFKSVNGSAESTTLSDDSVDFVTAAQSFHWFQVRQAGHEFRRILKRNGWVVLIWNTRKTSTPFLQGYEELVIRISRENKNRVKHEDLTGRAIAEFLGKYKMVKLDNSHELDLRGLIGRLLSASYSPLPDEPMYSELVRGATDLFNRSQQNGRVKFEYWTEVYAGHLS
jgi:ubiquinone/menaquinone biosynthesis C-methylase UbiE